MDGLSTDNTVNIAQDYEDKRVKIYSEKDSGIYDAMNKGIDASKGKWLYFLGSDDYLFHDNVLRLIYKQVYNKDLDVIYGNILNPLYDGKYDGTFSYAKILKKNICHQAIFFRKSLFEQTGYFNLKYKILADYDHNLKWFLSKKYKIEYIDEIIAYFSADGYSTTSNEKDPFQKDKTYNYILYGCKKLPKVYLLKVCRRALRSNKHNLGKKFVIVLIAVFVIFRL
jgi:glycosyltransferase involved in cell wall biosynthesis